MVIGETAFTAFVWANVLLVFGVFAYEVYAIATDHRTGTH